MSLNTVNLTPALLTSLYEKVLVESVASSVPAKKELSYLGKNKKNILLVTSSVETKFITESETVFLASVLAACKLSFDDLALVNWQNKAEQDGDSICQLLQSKTILLFDVSPAEFGLPINFPQFQIQPFNGRTYLYLPFLKGFEQDVALKKQLWTALKQLFQL